jgi:hypothetical protein
MIRELNIPIQILSCIVLVMVASPGVYAGESRSHIEPLSHQIDHVKTIDFPCCSDEYCRKPIPYVISATSFCTNSYHPKTFICLPCPANKFCQNEYCPKPPPKKCLPKTNRWLKCVSQAHKYCCQATMSQRNAQQESRRQE